MEYVTKHTVKLDNEVLPPNTPVEIKDKKQAKVLLDQGAIEERRVTPSEAKRAAAEDEEKGAAGKAKGEQKGAAGKGTGEA